MKFTDVEPMMKNGAKIKLARVMDFVPCHSEYF